jgi:hypothetical protein
MLGAFPVEFWARLLKRAVAPMVRGRVRVIPTRDRGVVCAADVVFSVIGQFGDTVWHPLVAPTMYIR